MPVVQNTETETMAFPGLRHQTIAGYKQGLKTMEVWMQTIAPGVATPVHRHACEEVVLILSGSGTCTIGGEVTHFVGVMNDVTEAKTYEAQLERISRAVRSIWSMSASDASSNSRWASSKKNTSSGWSWSPTSGEVS